MIDITMTATVRPYILERTLDSFFENMLKNTKRDLRLILNVDPIGDEDYRQEDVLIVAKKYFKDIVYNFPDKPGFCEAVIWCWKNTVAPYIFHLEDDWILMRNVDLLKITRILNETKNLVSVRLNKEHLTDGEKLEIVEGCDIVYSNTISLNPTIFTGNFVRNIVPVMDSSLNPEKQLRPSQKTKRGRMISLCKNAIYIGSGYSRIVLDIGREWMNASKFEKETGFRNWKIKEEN